MTDIALNPTLTASLYLCIMAYQAADFETFLTTAAGEDIELRAELRRSFVESLNNQVDLLQRARCDANWSVAAQRLRSLASSFHSAVLTSLAEQALDSAPGDPAIVRKLQELAKNFDPDA